MIEIKAVSLPLLPTDAGVITGYAALFDGVPDHHGDTLSAGCFSASLVERKAAGMPAMLSEHGGPAVGRWLDVTEDDTGLKVHGRLDLLSSAGRKVFADLKSGRTSGLSIGFKTLHADPRPGGGRVLRRLDLVEVSVVRNPARAPGLGDDGTRHQVPGTRHHRPAIPARRTSCAQVEFR